MKRTAALAVLAVVVLLACQDEGLFTDLPDSPVAALSDGANGVGGNPDFFFLPPLVANPVNHPEFERGMFHPGLYPVVKVFEVPSDPLAECTIGTSPVADLGVAPVYEADEMYRIDWDTKATDLEVGADYRVCVFSSSHGAALGFVDVIPIANGAKNRRTGEYYEFRDGRTLPIRFRIEHGALCDNDDDCTEGTATTEGGDFTLPSYFAAVSLPPGAVGELDTVTIVIEGRQLYPGERCYDGPLTQADGCYHFRTEPPHYEFKQAVRLEACVGVDNLTTDQIDQLLLHKYNEADGLVALPWSEPTAIDCTDYDPYAMGEGAESPVHFATAWNRLERWLAAAFLPTPLEAARPPKGLLSRQQSRFGAGRRFAD